MLKQPFKYILKKIGLAQLGVFFGYLRASGWLKSLWSKTAVDANGQPLPWYNYSIIHFLNQRLTKYRHTPNSKLRVFEFGSGNSTLWWAKLATEVVAVEDDQDWYAYIAKNMPPHATYHLAKDQATYLRALLDETRGFDVIIVDGSYRPACIEICSEKLSEDGIIVVDDTEWDILQPALALLTSKGFRRIEFYGLGPINGHPSGTSILYRPNNLLGI